MGPHKAIHRPQKTLATRLAEAPFKSAITSGFPPISLLLPKGVMPLVGIFEGQLPSLYLLYRYPWHTTWQEIVKVILNLYLYNNGLCKEN